MFVEGDLTGGREPEMFVTGDRLFDVTDVTGVTGDRSALHGVMGLEYCHPVVYFGSAVGR